MQAVAFHDALRRPHRDGSLRPHRTHVRRVASLPRCHRSLIADALVARGIPVEHILTPTGRKPHALTSFAVVRDRKILYPVEVSQDSGSEET